MLRVLLLAALASSACGARSVVIHRPSDVRVDDAITTMWAEDLRANAEHGDWIVSRSYSLIGDMIAMVTPGSWSHAALYDRERDVIIESIDSGVREIPVENFVARNYHVAVVRPSGTTARSRALAVERARAALGTPYDTGALIGLDDEAKFTCAELVLWSSDPAERRIERPIVLAPVDLFAHGEMVYYTGTRDDRDVLLLAFASLRD